MAMKLVVLLAVLGTLVIATGVGMIYLPAGVITAGLELLAGCYVALYLRAKS